MWRAISAALRLPAAARRVDGHARKNGNGYDSISETRTKFQLSSLPCNAAHDDPEEKRTTGCADTGTLPRRVHPPEPAPSVRLRDKEDAPPRDAPGSSYSAPRAG